MFVLQCRSGGVTEQAVGILLAACWDFLSDF